MFCIRRNKLSSFRDLRIVDNFYQTSAFFPMPTVLIGTLTEDGKTSLGPYSLVQPYYVAGKDYYAMLLCARNNSNTAQQLLARGKCSINFITDEKKWFKEAVKLSWPGDTPEEKMKNCQFTLEDGLMAKAHPEQAFPKVVTQSFQVFECTWMSDLENAFEDKPGHLDGYPPPYRNFNGITSQFGAHFILRVDKILMKEKQYQGIVNGVKAKDFPRVPVDYGYRDSKNFWYTRFSRPIPEILPMRKGTLQSVRYAADRIDPDIGFDDAALEKLLNVPRVFLNTVLKGCVSWAKENDVSYITAEHMDIINDKRAKEKQR
jgi:flavin reductase (DIM6/NTAB) family NADH-FMN oxidoreductase RutF